MHLLTLMGTLTAGLLAAQAPDPALEMKASTTGVSSSTIKITLTNRSQSPLNLMTPPAALAFKVTATLPDGSQAPETQLAGRYGHPGSFSGIGRFNTVTLQPGESFDQELDIALLAVLSEGTYDVNVSKKWSDGNGHDTLTTDVTITIPGGFSSNNACSAEASSKIAAMIRPGPLRGEEAASQSTELETDLLRRVDGPSRPAHTRNDSFIGSLRSAGVPGGLSLTNDKVAGPQAICIVEHESVREALAKMQAINPHFFLDGQSPVVNLLDDRTSDFLETRIARVVIPSPFYAMNDAFNALFDVPEVKSRMIELGLKDGSIARLPTMAFLRKMADREAPIILENATLRQGLNQIVRRLGTGIWMYEESKTDPNHRVFTLGFVYQSSDARK